METFDTAEPTTAELRAIDAEWPLIAAELAVVDAEIATARMGDGATELGRRRMRRAQAQRDRQIAAATRHAGFLDGVA